MTTARSWVLWWLVLFGLWIVIEGTNEAMELAAGAGAAAVAATLAEALRRQGLLAFAPGPRWLLGSYRLPHRLLYEFALVTWAVVPRLRGRPSRGRWSASPFPEVGADARSAGDRAAALVLENVTPNTMAAEIDRERAAALEHDLLPGHGNTVLPE
ncbi:MAG: Na+/H+ antiporter subunit E [Gaiellaceae bacterium]